MLRAALFLAPLCVSLTSGSILEAQEGSPRASGQKPWAQYNRGIRWEPSLGAAVERAWAENKLILFFLMVGDLDKDGC